MTNNEMSLNKPIDHIKEPWAFDPSTNLIYSKDSGEVIFELNSYPLSTYDNINANRIINAINATKNIPNEALNSDSFRKSLKGLVKELKINNK